MDIKKMHQKLEKLLSGKRLKHSMNVANEAVKLSELYGCDKEKAYIAGLLHDCAKCLSKEQMDYYVDKYNIELENIEKNNNALSHGIIGSYIVKNEFMIDDIDLINSIKFHTTGREDMTLLEKIIYIADLIEEDRSFEGVNHLRELTYNNLDEGILLSFNNTIKFVIDNNQIIHPRTINARNYLMKKINS